MPGEIREPVISAQKRRASVVCYRCHGKKIKCDIAEAPTSQSCSNCAQAKAPCRVRPSKRGSGKGQSPVSHQISGPESLRNQDNDLHSHPIHILTDNGTHGQSPPVSSLSQATQPLFHVSTRLETTKAPYSVDAERGLHGGSVASSSSPSVAQAHSILSTETSSSPFSSVRASCFGDTGYMQILSRDNVLDEVGVPHQPLALRTEEMISSALQESFLESYFEYCFIWCPVLDRDFIQSQPDVNDSPLFQQALALCGNRINPPLIQCRDSAVYYNRAKELFYSNQERNALVRITSIMLFFWWSTGSPNLLNTDNAWWWTGITIRIAQECGLHRELPTEQLEQAGQTVGLRRRIWWTLFARDRILSISQGRPTMIDPDYCNVKMITRDDFPDPSDPKVEIFINWVKLQEITGRISKHLSKRVEDRTDGAILSHNLVSWVQTLPGSLSLSIRTNRTVAFDRDVHRLYVTYLTNITLLHMNNSSQLLPRATKVAIVAASCVARLFEDFLTRGNIRFLSGDAGWEIAVAILTLVNAHRIEELRPYADADIQTLRTALQQMSMLWPSSRMFNTALDKLLSVHQTSTNNLHNPIAGAEKGQEEATNVLVPLESDTNWMDYFPFVTDQTSPLINALLVQDPPQVFTRPNWPLDVTMNLQEFLSQHDYYSFDMFNV